VLWLIRPPSSSRIFNSPFYTVVASPPTSLPLSPHTNLVTMAPKIEATYYGRRALDWIPDAVEESTSAETQTSDVQIQPFSMSDSQYLEETQSQSVPTNHAELLEAFRAHLRDEIDGVDSQYVPTKKGRAAAANKQKGRILLLALAHTEETSRMLVSMEAMMAHRSPEEYFYNQVELWLPSVDKIDQFLRRDKLNEDELESASIHPSPTKEEDISKPEKKRKLDTGKEPGTKSTTETKRTKEDLAAQHEVKTWHDGQCVLTGGQFPEGAHILPVKITRHEGIEDFWKQLRLFWSWKKVDKWKAAIEEKGYEVKNILPLRVDAHRLWDRRQFTIRPINDPQEPERRLFLQVVWLKGFDRKKGIVKGDPDYRKIAIVDQRCGDSEQAPYIKTGDIYELVTSDSVLFPLPSSEILRLQYALHCLMSSLTAAGSLKAIFRDDPPDVDPVASGEVTVPSDWARLIEAAMDEGILDSAAAEIWGAAFGLQAEKDARLERQRAREDLEFWMRGLKDSG
jgi:hypothetical protein